MNLLERIAMRKILTLILNRAMFIASGFLITVIGLDHAIVKQFSESSTVVLTAVILWAVSQGIALAAKKKFF